MNRASRSRVDKELHPRRVHRRAGRATGISTAAGNAAGLASLFTADTVGYIVGGFALDKSSPDGGKFILLLRRTGRGPWRIAADMDNGNRR